MPLPIKAALCLFIKFKIMTQISEEKKACLVTNVTQEGF